MESESNFSSQLPLFDFNYIKSNDCSCEEQNKIDLFSTDSFALYKVEKITFEKEAPKKEALENVITSMSRPGANLLYIILGDKNKVEFYFGVSKDFSSIKAENLMEVSDVGSNIMKPALQGNFRGSSIKELSADEKEDVIIRLDAMKRMRLLEGVPGINKDDDKFQTVNRLVDIMFGDLFALLIIAKPLNLNDISSIRKGICETYDLLSLEVKKSLQQSSGTSDSNTIGLNTGTSTTTGSSSSTSITNGKSDSNTSSNNESKTKGNNTGWSKGDGTSNSHTHSVNNPSRTDGTTETTTTNNKDSNTGLNTSHSTATSHSITENTGKSNSDTQGESSSNSKSGGTNNSETKGTSESKTIGSSDSTSETSGKSDSKTESSGKNESQTQGKSLSKSITTEIVNKNLHDWIKYIDDILLPRLDYSAGKGNFILTVAMLGEKNAQVFTLESALRSIYSGEKGNKVPLHGFDLSESESYFVRRFQIPVLRYKETLTKELKNFKFANSQFINEDGSVSLGYWMSSREVSLLCGLPQKEVIGLDLSEEVEFGLSIPEAKKDFVKLGHLVESGLPLDGKNDVGNIEIKFDPKNFDKHIFISGVTGSGKTTTCQKFLLGRDCGFLVIEPAKTEYRILQKTKFPDMLIFTLGNDQGIPFRLNPFEFFEGESITSRVDMIKASMESSFEMEAAIPQLLESALYLAYEKKGWDITSNKWTKSGNPFGDCYIDAFPTISDVIGLLDEVVENADFGDEGGRIKGEYKGSIKARLQSLTVGSKGLMLDVPRSINFIDLLDRKVVLELESIKSASEKSLIMGFILSNLNEAIRARYNDINKNLKDGEESVTIKHITLIEEAHRLLSRYEPGDSQNKKQGVEMFSDMLAEIRKYGESLIIADQIPNKLTPEVLKNTNTKIIHKIFAKDDKDAVGNIMALKDNQKNQLSYLPPGRGVLSMPGLDKAILVQIEQTEDNDTKRNPPKDQELRKQAMDYYIKKYKTGVVFPLEELDSAPSDKALDLYFENLQKKSIFWIYFEDIIKENGESKVLKNFISKLNELMSVSDFSIKNLAKIICRRYVCKEIEEDDKQSILKTIDELLVSIINNTVKEFNFINDNIAMLHIK